MELKYTLYKSSKYILIFFFLVILYTYFGEIIFYNIFKSIFPNFIKKQKKEICICTLGKEENKYIKHFVEHYKNLGVDKIFLYDNNDKNGENFEDVLSEYIKEGFIEILNYRGKIAPQLKVFEHCYNKYQSVYDWIIFFDIDEFIHLSNYTNIKKFLHEKKFDKCKLIYFNCVRHTDNDLLYYDSRPLEERFPIIHWNSSMYTLKSIIRGNITNHIKFTTTHWLNRGLKKGCNVFGKFVHPTWKVQLGDSINHPKYKMYYIDHYCFKSTEEYINKINKGDGEFGFKKRIKMHKIQLYFEYNRITLKKINYIENKTGLNLEEYKLMLQKE